MAALEREFGVSPATARRDLAELERQGKLRRTHGGAVMPGLAQHEDSFQQRLGEAVEAKERLARAASELLEAEETGDEGDREDDHGRDAPHPTEVRVPR